MTYLLYAVVIMGLLAWGGGSFMYGVWLCITGPDEGWQVKRIVACVIAFTLWLATFIALIGNSGSSCTSDQVEVTRQAGRTTISDCLPRDEVYPRG